MRLLALNGLLGYGYDTESLAAAMAKARPDVIGVDAGSTDPGPHYLGSGKSFTSRAAVKRDLAFALPLALAKKIPFLIGSAGGAGGNVHVDWQRSIIEEIAREQGLCFRMMIIRTELDKQYVTAKWRAGKIHPMGPALPGSEQAITESERIVSQIGTAPFIKALESGVDVVLAGRACDTAIYAAPAIRTGLKHGLAFHMGKIMECGCLCAEPQSAADVLTAETGADYFILEPAGPARRCTVEKVAAHTLYEQSSPTLIHEPDGVADVSSARYEQINERAVRVCGAGFKPAEVKMLKIEGATLAGYRTIAPAAIHDHRTINRLASLFEETRRFVASALPANMPPDSYRLLLKTPGGKPEPESAAGLVVILEAVADTQEQADTVCALARSRLLHCDYPGRRSTAGNLAFPYSPSDISTGPVYNFSLYHLMEVDDFLETALFETVAVGDAHAKTC